MGLQEKLQQQPKYAAPPEDTEARTSLSLPFAPTNNLIRETYLFGTFLIRLSVVSNLFFRSNYPKTMTLVGALSFQIFAIPVPMFGV